MALAIKPERAKEGRRPLWPFLPFVVVLGLFLWIVPGSFVHMALIHSDQMDEFEQLPGYVVVERDLHLYPHRWGGTLILERPPGQSARDLARAAEDLGYGRGQRGEFGIEGRRGRSDDYDADTFVVRELDEQRLQVDVAVFDTDIVLAWPILGFVALVLGSAALSVGAVIRSRIDEPPAIAAPTPRND